MKKSASGFTIVELLIVIVIIAILAAISTVVYSGLQQRAQNTKTIAAVRQWVQIIDMYKADRGSYPTRPSCLGEGYGFGFSGDGSHGDGQCRQGAVGGEVIHINPAFIEEVSDYIGGSSPTPAFVMASNASSMPWYRGAYYYTATPRRIDYVLAGSSTECPSITGKEVTRQVYAATNSVACRIRFPVD